MSREKLYLNSEDSGGANVLTTSLDFVRKINNNNAQKSYNKGLKYPTIDLDTNNTAMHISRALTQFTGIGDFSTSSKSDMYTIKSIVPNWNDKMQDDSNYNDGDFTYYFNIHTIRIYKDNQLISGSTYKSYYSRVVEISLNLKRLRCYIDKITSNNHQLAAVSVFNTDRENYRYTIYY